MSLRQKSARSWELRVYVPDPVTGRSVQRSFTIRAASERDARKQAAIIQAEVLERKRVVSDAGKATMTAFAGMFLKSIQVSRLKPKTQQSYEFHLTHYVLPRIGHVRLDQITTEMLDRLYGELLAEGLSARTVELTHAIIRRALGVAVKWKAIPYNPAADASPPRPQRKPKPSWTPDQLRTFLDATEDHPMGLVWRIGGLHGLRRGEVLGLAWRDVDWERGTVSISRQYLTVGGASVLDDSTKTTGSARIVHLDARTLELLREKHDSEARYTSGLIFDQGDGKPWHPDSVSKAFIREVRRLGLPYMPLHGLRHTSATLALRSGIPLKVVSERLGHSSVAITGDIYQDVHDEVHAAAAERMADLLNGRDIA